MLDALGCEAPRCTEDVKERCCIEVLSLVALQLDGPVVRTVDQQAPGRADELHLHVKHGRPGFREDPAVLDCRDHPRRPLECGQIEVRRWIPEFGEHSISLESADARYFVAGSSGICRTGVEEPQKVVKTVARQEPCDC